MKPRLRLQITAVLLLMLPLFGGCRLFVSYYTLSIEAENGTGGSISCEPQRKEYPENTIVTLTAVPEAGWELESWAGVTNSNGNNATVLMDLNRKVTAFFRPILKDNNPSDNKVSALSIGFAPTSDDSWTFMVYLDADNSLDPYAIADFNEIEKGFSAADNANLNIIVLLDRYEDGCSVYRVTPDLTDGIDSTPLYPLIDGKQMLVGTVTELNMGKPEVLTDFLKFCRNESPTDHYALMFWNHGGGTRSLSLDIAEPVLESRLICADENTGDESTVDYLFMDEVQKALEQAIIDAPFSTGIDVISLDACIMGTVEAAYELRNLSSYYVASMSNVAASGWDYNELFGRMGFIGGGATAEALSFLMVDSFRNTMITVPEQSITAVRSIGLNGLKSSIDRLATVLYLEDEQTLIEYIRDAAVDFFNDDYEAEVIAQPYHDLNDICWLLINNEKYLSTSVTAAASDVLYALGDVVISAYAGLGLGNYYGIGAELQRGLSIFFSKGNLQSNGISQYAKQYWYTDQDSGSLGPMGFLDFCTSDTDSIVESWREMHEAWYDPFRPYGFTPGCW